MILQTPKGFRDFLPKDALKRKVTLDKITKVFERFGFDPLETPTLEYEETLTGKYGEEEKLIYKFKTPGGDKVALKYDQTVPLARVVAQYGPSGSQKLPIPFKRYQIQSAYRGENPQAGRYREFLQCDGDIVGISTPLVDAELLALMYEIYKDLGLDVMIKVNDRKLFMDIEGKYLSAIDKLNKIGKDEVLKELEEKGLTKDESEKLIERFLNLKKSEDLEKILLVYFKMGYPETSVKFDPTLIRGLDYYTGIIMEVVLKDDPLSLSLCGGGRYDKMIGKFSGVDLPANGFSVGLERTMNAMERQGILDTPPTSTKVLVTIFSPELEEKSIDVTLRLRSENISTEIWLDPNTKLEKQLKYADQKGIPFVVIIGPEEEQKGQLVLKNLQTGAQKSFPLDKLDELLATLSH